MLKLYNAQLLMFLWTPILITKTLDGVGDLAGEKEEDAEHPTIEEDSKERIKLDEHS